MAEPTEQRTGRSSGVSGDTAGCPHAGTTDPTSAASPAPLPWTASLPWPPARAEDSDAPPIELAGLVAAGTPVRVQLWDGSWAWLVTRHDQARDVLRDRRFTAVTSAPGFPMLTRISALVRAQPASASFIRMDDPDHARLRGMLTREFLARAVEVLRPAVRAWLDEAFTAVAGSDVPIDLVSTIADPLPSATIAMLLGVPAERTAFFQERGATLIDHHTTADQARIARDEVDDLLRELIEQRLAEPPSRADLVRRLVADHLAPEHAGTPAHLSVDEAVPMCRLLLLAGHATTANQGSLSLLTLLRDAPGTAGSLRETLTRDPGALAPAVDELLRLHSIVQNGLARAAVQDVEVGGVLIAAGEGVVISLAAADRDPLVFPDPDALVLDRDRGRHLAFGFGAHQCLGLWLARLELEELLAATLRHLPDARLTVPVERLRFRTRATNFGVLSLPVTRPGRHDVPALPDPDAVAERTRWVAGLLTDPQPQVSTAGRVIDGFGARWPHGFAAVVDGWRAGGPFTVTRTDVLCHKGTVALRSASGAPALATVTCDTSGLVRLVQFSGGAAATVVDPDASVESLLDSLDAFLTRPGVDGSAVLARIDAAGTSETRWSRGADVLRPLGSVSKLYALLAAAQEVRAGRLHWDDPLTLRARLRSLPTGDTQGFAEGTVLSARTAAVKMIALSDNTAHDLLLERIGPERVITVMHELGHSDPAANTPFLSTRELFALGWSGRVTREEWAATDAADARRALASRAAAEPLTVRVADMTTPVHAAGLDWFASPADLVRLWTELLRCAAQDPVVDAALTANAGVSAARDHWHWAAFKGGSTPGALSFTWAVRDAAGHGHVLAVTQVSADPELVRDPRPTLERAEQLLAALASHPNRPTDSPAPTKESDVHP